MTKNMDCFQAKKEKVSVSSHLTDLSKMSSIKQNYTDNPGEVMYFCHAKGLRVE